MVKNQQRHTPACTQPTFKPPLTASGIGRGLDNVFRERLSRSVKSENTSLNQYDLAHHLQTDLTAYCDLYIHERPHPTKCT